MFSKRVGIERYRYSPDAFAPTVAVHRERRLVSFRGEKIPPSEGIRNKAYFTNNHTLAEGKLHTYLARHTLSIRSKHF